ncbi:MAG TPA: cation diffusion facilitator family transporter [Gammaproteobacteria bacterium]|jgi:cobalt-zinc-cadmium efflux system protein|nr:cation diffusion facilitator family transporter [Gammaproteobacteria bacterium]
MHGHAPDHDHSHRHSQGHFWLAFAVTLGFAGLEALAGYFAHSLALLGDAGHMATDSAALLLAGLAGLMAARPASHRHSYGFGRVEVIAALVNTLLMLGIMAGIGIEAVARLRHPEPVQAPLVIGVGLAGLLVNYIIYRVVERGHENLNVRATLLHVLSDMLGSGAALAAGVVIQLTGWLPIDPLLSLFIALLILISSLRLLRDAGQVLLEGVPPGMDLGDIGRSMAGVEGVGSIHDLHVWCVSSEEVALSAHVVIEDMGQWEAVYQGLRSHLHDGYGIEHITLQPEPRVKARIAVETISRRQR